MLLKQSRRSLLFYIQCNLIEEAKIFPLFSLQWQEVDIWGKLYSACIPQGPEPEVDACRVALFQCNWWL